MSRFRFTLSNDAVRQEGTVESDTFTNAVETLWQHVDVKQGDVLEIGVLGFPPARFECVAEIGEGKPFWTAA
jgi:hypothetical protein